MGQKKSLPDLTPLEYSPDLQAWVPRKKWTPPKHDVIHRQFKVVTFNIWFEMDVGYEKRYAALIKLVQDQNPDVVVFQEVVKEFLSILTNTEWVQKSYLLSDVTGKTLDQYGVILMSRLPTVSMHLMDLPTEMGRKLLWADMLLNGVMIRVATVHLESLQSFEEVRKSQLQQILPTLEKGGLPTFFFG